MGNFFKHEAGPGKEGKRKLVDTEEPGKAGNKMGGPPSRERETSHEKKKGKTDSQRGRRITWGDRGFFNTGKAD